MVTIYMPTTALFLECFSRAKAWVISIYRITIDLHNAKLI